ncbi:hypothetical protein [Nonomuraea dietziae]|uniref:hypothetical protein n=1 Tax=Nonomuraea dietziae TaxID=65515 RepID=UPI0031D83538
MREQESVAWVESPLQMLCAVSRPHHAGLLGDRTLVVPRAGLRPLAATRRELVGLALPEGLELAKPQERMPRRLNAVGDAFSGRVQLRWITSRSGRVVIVDVRPWPRSGCSNCCPLDLPSRCCGPAPLPARGAARWACSRRCGCARGRQARARCRSSPPCPCPTSWLRPYGRRGWGSPPRLRLAARAAAKRARTGRAHRRAGHLPGQERPGGTASATCTGCGSWPNANRSPTSRTAARTPSTWP